MNRLSPGVYYKLGKAFCILGSQFVTALLFPLLCLWSHKKLCPGQGICWHSPPGPRGPLSSLWGERRIMKAELQKTPWLPNNSIPKAVLCHNVGLCFGSEPSQITVHVLSSVCLWQYRNISSSYCCVDVEESILWRNCNMSRQLMGPLPQAYCLNV